MNAFSLSWRMLWARPLQSLLSVLLLALGVALLVVLLLVQQQAGRSLAQGAQGVDLVVGAKGSPLQLILSSVLHIDMPTGNIPLAEFNKLQTHPQIAEALPISLGDNAEGFRIVGTTPRYAEWYGGTLQSGQFWAAPMQAVLGAQVAAQTRWAIGNGFAGHHGLGAGGHSHGATPYSVVGILQPCQCVLDTLILTSTESVWKVHEDHNADTEEDKALLAEEREVTAALIRYKSPLAAVSLPRQINQNTQLQAASPAFELTRLLRMVGLGADVLKALAAALMLVASLSMLMALWQALRERQTDLAMLRLLGSPPARLVALLLAHAFWLALFGLALGLCMGHALTHLLGQKLLADGGIAITGWQWHAQEWLLLAGVFLLALLACLPPIWAVYRIDVMHTLNERKSA